MACWHEDEKVGFHACSEMFGSVIVAVVVVVVVVVKSVVLLLSVL